MQKDIVWSAQAKRYFESGSYSLAAQFYGKTTKSFEEITLKFIGVKDQNALKNYLLAKLDTMKHSGSKVRRASTELGSLISPALSCASSGLFCPCRCLYLLSLSLDPVPCFSLS